MLEGKVIMPSGTQPTNPVRVKLTFNGRAIHETFYGSQRTFFVSRSLARQVSANRRRRRVTFETTTVYADISAFGSSAQSFTQDIQLRPIAPNDATAGRRQCLHSKRSRAAKQALDLG